MNVIQWGLQWHKSVREQSTSTLATINHVGGTTSAQATLIEPGSLVDVNGIRIKVDHLLMMFETEDVKAIRWNRGVKIEKDNKTYEVIVDGERREEFDDAERITTNVPVKICS